MGCDTMFCENCGKKLEEGSLFCNVCGAKQPQPVFCIQCGKRLEPRSLFCNGCGASQMPKAPEATVPQAPELPRAAEPMIPEMPEPVLTKWPQMEEPPCEEPPVQEVSNKKKKSKKWLIPVIALVAAIAVAAMLLIPALFPKSEETVTVYLLTGRTEWIDGEQTSKTVVEYDELGRPTAIRWDDMRTVECTMKYDRYGNRTEEKSTTTISYMDANGVAQEISYGDTYTYDFEYRDDGRIRKCTVFRTDGEETVEVEKLKFTYDDHGNVILVEYDWSPDDAYSPAWDHYVYDEQGRLVQETFCMFSKLMGADPKDLTQIHLTRYTYGYDENGDLDRLCRSGAVFTGTQAPEYDELEGVELTQYEEYSLNIRNGHILIEDCEDLLDENGNPSGAGDTFDEHGNLIREEGTVQRKVDGVTVEYEAVTEYTYEAVELPKSDAQRAQRLMEACCLPSEIISYAIYVFGDAFLGWRTRPVALHMVSNTGFYYYLIPNPIC